MNVRDFAEVGIAIDQRTFMEERHETMTVVLVKVTSFKITW